ncbi:hypothetical protein DIPPA_08531 [Diplonema papillatum]|nr:hypothetical protein DIPPA_08531 [Diplonema papillatum]
MAKEKVQVTLAKCLGYEVLKLVQRNFLTAAGGLYVNSMLQRACARHGVEGTEMVVGVCAVPDDKYFKHFTLPHAWIRHADGAITDLETGKWGPILRAFQHVWYDGERVEFLLRLSAANADELLSVREDIILLHQDGFPFKVPVIEGNPLAPDIKDMQFSRWYYATGDEADAMISEEERPEDHEDLVDFRQRLAAAAANEGLLLSSCPADLENQWYAMQAKLDEVAEEWHKTGGVVEIDLPEPAEQMEDPAADSSQAHDAPAPQAKNA